MIEGKKEELTNRIAKALAEEAKGDLELAKNAAIEGINDVEKLKANKIKVVNNEHFSANMLLGDRNFIVSWYWPC